jgi:hypothetical protein
MKKLLLVAALFLPTWANTITMDFTVNMQWRYDLSTNAFDPTFRPFTMNIQAVVDDAYVGVVLSTPTSTRIAFAHVAVTSPLSSLFNLGVDPSTLTSRSSLVTLQDENGMFQATWTMLSEVVSNGSGSSLSRTLEFNNDPRLANFSTFASSDLDAFMLAQVGDQWDYREDSGFAGVGFQNFGVATLTSVNIGLVPEPSYGGAVLAMRW